MFAFYRAIELCKLPSRRHDVSATAVKSFSVECTEQVACNNSHSHQQRALTSCIIFCWKRWCRRVVRAQFASIFSLPKSTRYFCK